MVNKLTPREEQFARAFLETGNATEAYRRSYSWENMTAGAIAVEGHRILKRPKVARIIAEARLEVQARLAVTLESITEELEWARLQAMEKGNVSAAIAAIIGKAKMHGLFKERIELGGHVQVANTDLYRKMTPEERSYMRQILINAAARLPAPANDDDEQAGVVPMIEGRE